MEQSELEKPIQRALSSWLESAFKNHIVSEAALIKHFDIKKVITSLSPEVRGLVLCTCNGGGDAKRAAKIDADSVALMIASMLKDKIVTEKVIMEEISFDHLVEVLSNDMLYTLIFGNEEKRPWRNGSTSSKAFMAAAHEVIHAEKLLSPASYVKILGEETFIHEETPAKLLIAGQRKAIAMNREGQVFTDTDLIGIYTPAELVDYVELTALFPAVEAVAREQSWIEEKAEVAEDVAEADSEEDSGEDKPTIPPEAAVDDVILIDEGDSLPPAETEMVLEIEEEDEDDSDPEVEAALSKLDDAKEDSKKKAAVPPPPKKKDKKSA